MALIAWLLDGSNQMVVGLWFATWLDWQLADNPIADPPVPKAWVHRWG